MSPRPPPQKMFGIKRIALGLKSLALGPKNQRLRVLNELSRLIVSLLSSNYVGDNYKMWLLDSEFRKMFRKLSPHNFFSEERKYTLKEITKSLKNIDGNIAECGCYVGASAWFIANELPNTDFYLFDSFEGLSEPNKYDQSKPGVHQWKKGDFDVPEELLRKNLSCFRNIHIKKGWIPERFNEVEDKKFRLVHIDVDLYQPTFDSLSFFYERMTPGGIIVMDDYGFLNCPGAFKAANDFIYNKPEQIIQLSTGQGIIIRHCDAIIST
ncbi:SAM-dependent methyltransferase [hydrothermal vent metagenome]|uniref:SAM-dependent methyltransferase n=1 Tax=hydrothermal vent metagenome TaxID=652676 RepID=A0A3B0VPT7_9ZZZZ